MDGGSITNNHPYGVCIYIKEPLHKIVVPYPATHQQVAGHCKILTLQMEGELTTAPHIAAHK